MCARSVLAVQSYCQVQHIAGHRPGQEHVSEYCSCYAGFQSLLAFSPASGAGGPSSLQGMPSTPPSVYRGAAAAAGAGPAGRSGAEEAAIALPQDGTGDVIEISDSDDAAEEVHGAYGTLRHPCFAR